jgi:hypothetical protein
VRPSNKETGLPASEQLCTDHVLLIDDDLKLTVAIIWIDEPEDRRMVAKDKVRDVEQALKKPATAGAVPVDPAAGTPLSQSNMK